MPILAGLLASLFGGVASFFVQFLTKKIAVVAAAIVAIGTAFGILMAAFNTLVAPLASAMFRTSYGQFLGLAFPPMAGQCLTAITACWIACALYKLKVQSIKLTASA